ncbi:MAG: hypothetical protein M3P49_14170 [Actinomycetota bacterium]|nr:hypothetical protein [Actinomycetota bacterium]
MGCLKITVSGPTLARPALLETRGYSGPWASAWGLVGRAAINQLRGV